MAQNIEQVSYLVDAPIALVIGCGDMGMGSARALGRRHPLLLTDIDADRLAACAEQLRNEGYKVQAQPCDITDAEQVAQLGQVVAQTRGIRILAHVAAVGNSPKGWRHVIEVDLIGAHRIARMADQHMIRGGAAIFVSSTGSYRCPVGPEADALADDPFQPEYFEKLVRFFGGEPHFLDAYFLSKQGVNRLAARLAQDWGARDVRAVSLSPGLIDSSMGRGGGALLPVYDGSTQKRLGTRSEKAAAEVPLRRQGTVIEVVSVLDFLASDAASFISGIDVPVDGGSTAKWRGLGEIQR